MIMYVPSHLKDAPMPALFAYGFRFMTRASGYRVAWARGLMIKLPHRFSRAWGDFSHDYFATF